MLTGKFIHLATVGKPIKPCEAIARRSQGPISTIGMAMARAGRKVGLAALLIGGSAFASGCQIVELSAQNLVYETCQRVDDCTRRMQDRRAAEAAWEQVCKS